MPLIKKSSYTPPVYLRNGHFQTIFPTIFRTINTVSYTRKRVTTPDNDFLDCDWSCTGSDVVAVMLHGLEGYSGRAYMKGMVRACNKAGWDAVAINFRGCSGLPNNYARSYHNGSSDDLAVAINHISTLSYKVIVIIGFSLGGNVLLKYLGEPGWNYPSTLCAAVAISTPCHLTSSADRLSHRENCFYMKRFLHMLHKKIKVKQPYYPDLCNDDGYKNICTFKQFDDRYTAPLHGFSSAEDYWTKASSLQFIPAIHHPTLMISAGDDPFLTPHCFPRNIARNHMNVYLETPAYGGHCGFIVLGNQGTYWHEQRTVAFLKDYI